MHDYRDDPDKDYRGQYELPYHFLWDPNCLAHIDYDGYVDACFDLLPPAPLEVLDAGCGDGWVARRAEGRGYRVVGVDYSERAVAFARLLTARSEFHVRDLRELDRVPELSGRFEAALCVDVIEHLPPEYGGEVLAKIGGCLKPAGKLVMAVPSCNRPVTNQFHYKHYGVDEGRVLLEGSGFEVVRVVNQLKLAWITDPRLWRGLQNKYYDLKFIRAALRKPILARYNLVADPRRAGKHIFLARKK